MPCEAVSAALLAVCLTLPDLPEPPNVPVMPHWGIRQAVVSYKDDKTLISTRGDFFGWHAISALGNTKQYPFDRNVLNDRKTLYLYLARGHYAVVIMPMNKSMAMRWEFE